MIHSSNKILPSYFLIVFCYFVHPPPCFFSASPLSSAIRSSAPFFSALHSSHIVIFCDLLLCHVMSCHVMSCHVMSCHVVSCRVVSCRVMSCRVVSCQGLHALSNAIHNAVSLSSSLFLTTTSLVLPLSRPTSIISTPLFSYTACCTVNMFSLYHSFYHSHCYSFRPRPGSSATLWTRS